MILIILSFEASNGEAPMQTNTVPTCGLGIVPDQCNPKTKPKPHSSGRTVCMVSQPSSLLQARKYKKPKPTPANI
jgi:hypothetical protein